MAHLGDVADEAVSRVLRTLSPGSARDTLDGIPLTLDLRLDTHKDGQPLLVADFRGSGGPHTGNLNAPTAVVRAAVLYALRVLVGRPIPLNEGALRHVEILVPPCSIISPPPHAAVVGGNVETSQRLVDLFLMASGARAASQGTMNNLTLGGTRWSLYETIGGGLGASSTAAGGHGRQVHMTNTRATDVEIIEARFPLRLEQFSFRPDSGGSGRHRGGDGLHRMFRVLAETEAALLATRRTRGAKGLAGGQDGAPGCDRIEIDERWRTWDGSATHLTAGDRISVQTPGGGGYGGEEETE